MVSDPKTFDDIGNTLFEVQRYDEALKYFSKALDIDPIFFRMNNVGLVFLKLGQYMRALEYSTKH